MSLTNKWRSWRSKGRRNQGRTPRSCRLFVELLEDRLAPVIGAFNFAPPVLPGGNFDGVVQIGGCTGSLLYTGRHVLTAAHCVDADGTSGPGGVVGADRDGIVQIDLARAGVAIPITVRVPANAIIVHPNWSGNVGMGNDLAIIPLIDQEGLPNTRQLVAPFTAQQYHFFQGNALGSTFTQVGYGETGDGNEGERSDEVQRITLLNPAAGGLAGSFTLTFDDDGPGRNPPQTTMPIPAGAPAWQVAANLVNLGNIGTDAQGNPNVVVREVPGVGGSYDIRFLNDLGYRDVPLLTADGGGLIDGDPAAPNPIVFVTARFDGNLPGVNGVKRSGQNTIDQIVSSPGGPGNDIVRYDFDNGAPNQSSLVPPPGTGPWWLGANEGFGARGDSGGPGFIFNNNRWEIAFVKSYIESPGATDLTDYRTTAGVRRFDFSFGEINGDTLVTPHLNPFLFPNLGGRYDLVLDMNQQVLGADSQSEDLTISARMDNEDLVLEVTNHSAPGQFAGVYYRASIFEIRSLTLRGSDRNREHFVLGALPFPTSIEGRGGDDSMMLEWPHGYPDTSGLGPIAFQGGEGRDTLLLDDRGSWTGVDYTLDGLSILRNRQHLVAFRGVDVLNLRTGTGNDVVRVKSTSGLPDFTPDRIGIPIPVESSIETGGGEDQILVSGDASTLNSLRGSLAIHGGEGRDALLLDDSGHNLDADYDIKGSWIARNGNDKVFYQGIDSLEFVAGSGNDRIRVRNTSGLPPTLGGPIFAPIPVDMVVGGGNGGDAFLVSDDGGTLSSLRGNLVVDGQGGGTDSVHLDDHGSTAGHGYRFGVSHFHYDGRDLVAYKNVTSLTLDASSHADSIDVDTTLVWQSAGFLDGRPLEILAPLSVTVNSNEGPDAINVGGASQALGVIVGNLTVASGGGDDTVTVAGSALHSALVVHAGLDRDQFTINGGPGDESATLWPGRLLLTGSDYRVEADGAESMEVCSGGGYDRLVQHDSDGDDDFRATAAVVTMRGTTRTGTPFQSDSATVYSNTAHQFAEVTYDGASGGFDTALIDESAASLATSSGTWLTRWGTGYASSYRSASGGGTVDSTTWTFSVTPGWHRVSTTWVAGSDRSSKVRFALSDGSTTYQASSVNQKKAPSDFTAAGVPWHLLRKDSTATTAGPADLFYISSNSLTVTLADTTTRGLVIADAVRVERVPTPIVVTSTNDNGPGSLRAAILQANQDPDADTIVFNIPASDLGFTNVDAHLAAGDTAADTFVIRLTSAGLPALTTASSTIIDGRTQTWFSGDTNPFGPEIVLDGSLLTQDPVDGLTIWFSHRNRVAGLNIQGFSGHGISIIGSDDNWVSGNYIGTDATGTLARGNGRTMRQAAGGLQLSADAERNVIGTNGDGEEDLLEGNLISANARAGIRMQQGSVRHHTRQNVIAGNRIGTDASGKLAAGLGNGWDGILLWGVTENRVEGNILAGNLQNGLTILGAGSDDNRILRNTIVSNGGAGVGITGQGVATGPSRNVIGAADGEGNIIRQNGGPGVSVVGDSTGNTIQGNSISQNGGLGIDLGGDGDTLNDGNDADLGPNHRQNYPVLTQAVPATGSVIAGTLWSQPNTTYRLDFYVGHPTDAAKHGAGEIYLGGVANLATDTSGFLSFLATLPATIAVGQLVTATATDPQGNTSEFSAALPVREALVFTNSQAVPIKDVAWTKSSMQIDADFAIADLDVVVNIRHSYDGDLKVVIERPGGVFIPLISYRGGSGDNFTNTILDDEATARISEGRAPFTGRFRPEWALSAFDGGSAKGTWTLLIYDNGSLDVGMLESWSLIVRAARSGTGMAAAASTSVGATRLDPLVSVRTPNLSLRQTEVAGFGAEAAGTPATMLAIDAVFTEIGQERSLSRVPDRFGPGEVQGRLLPRVEERDRAQGWAKARLGTLLRVVSQLVLPWGHNMEAVIPIAFVAQIPQQKDL